jgi:hypothetical protein
MQDKTNNPRPNRDVSVCTIPLALIILPISSGEFGANAQNVSTALIYRAPQKKLYKTQYNSFPTEKLSSFQLGIIFFTKKTFALGIVTPWGGDLRSRTPF